MALTHDLPHFPLSGFHRPDLIHPQAAAYLVRLRDRCGFPLVVTDDARPAGSVPPGGSLTSWHLKGQAFDLRIRTWDAERLWQFVAAVMWLRDDLPPARAGLELELVWSAEDKHAHIAFTLDDRPSRLLVAAT